MCGIAGFVVSTGKPAFSLEAVRHMCAQMTARGPDAYGEWGGDAAGVSLGHRRLAIVDTNSRANQPMVSVDGRLVIAFNGEIYNFRALRNELEVEGWHFRTQSDTEVILALYAREREAMLSRLRGMFAIALWDSQERSLFLARDPYGIKPLYTARVPGGILVGSQVKALLASGLVSREPDPLGQAGFWMMGSVPEPRTWFRDIQAVPSGHWCRVDANGVGSMTRYWDIAQYWRDASECASSESEVQEQVRAALKDSVRHHLVADVPVGVFLSGGIDSGALAGLMKDAGAIHVVGATVAFPEFRGRQEDEVPAAREVAALYDNRHTVRQIARTEFDRDFRRIYAAMDQPSIDGVNTWYASKAIAELGLKVAVSGVGGDELFFGYPGFRQIPALVDRWHRIEGVPGATGLAALLLRLHARRTGNPRWARLPRFAGSLYGAYFLRRGLFSPEELPAVMGRELACAVVGDVDPVQLMERMAGPLPPDPMAAVGQLESTIYLRNQLLRDSDWASMDHSVELRTPLVDAWLLRELAPVMRAFGKFPGKRLLAQSPTIPLPESLIGRRKTGFGVPLREWLAGHPLIREMPAGLTGRTGVGRAMAWLSARNVYGPSAPSPSNA